VALRYSGCTARFGGTTEARSVDTVWKLQDTTSAMRGGETRPNLARRILRFDPTQNKATRGSPVGSELMDGCKWGSSIEIEVRVRGYNEPLLFLSLLLPPLCVACASCSCNPLLGLLAWHFRFSTFSSASFFPLP